MTHTAKSPFSPVSKIVFTGRTGLTEECEAVRNSNPTYTKWSHANAQLVFWSLTVTPGIYEKIDFTVTWENGETYEGRFDLHHIDEPQETWSGNTDLAEHILNNAFFYAEINLSTEMAKRRAACTSIKAEHVEEFRQMLATLRFTDI